MSKQSFRPEKPASNTASYPIQKEGRRTFLHKLAGLVAGGVVASSLLSACGGRSVGDEPDLEPPSPGFAPPMEAGVDTLPPPVSEGAALPPDFEPVWYSDGLPPPMDLGVPDTIYSLDASKKKD